MSLHLKTAKLARWQIYMLCWSGALLWLSGVAWLVLHNFMRSEGEFGPEMNPAEPWMLKLHGAAMIIAVLGIGSLLVIHIWRGWSYRSQRVLGLLLSAVLGVLIVSGYLLYYFPGNWVSITHWSTGLVSLPVFVLHYFRGRAIRRQ